MVRTAENLKYDGRGNHILNKVPQETWKAMEEGYEISVEREENRLGVLFV